MFNDYIFIIICFLLNHSNETQDHNESQNYVIKNRGYAARLCLNTSASIIEAKYSTNKNENCSKDQNMDNVCVGGFFYFCSLPCYEKRVRFNNQIAEFNNIDPPKYKFEEEKPIYKTHDDNLTIITDSMILPFLNLNNISIKFICNISSGISSNISYKIIRKSNYSLVCQLDLSRVDLNNSIVVGVNFSYGSIKTCIHDEILGQITLGKKLAKFNKYYLFTASIIPIFLVVLIWIFIVWNKKSNEKAAKVLNDEKKKNEETELKNLEILRRAFLDYQRAVQSFNNLGRLTPRHLLSFEDYLSRNLNVELKTESIDFTNDSTESFRSILLNQSSLLEWIDKMEKNCRAQERSLVASLLTIVLFQHPNYFLSIMKVLLKKCLAKLKSNSEERLLFRKSEAIVEKLVGNWISLCMYRNIKTGEIGKRFFNLYRAIKCKMETGLIDAFTKNAKYAFTFDHIMLGEMNYEELKIKSDVNVHLKLVDSNQEPLHIFIENLEVDVISLDSISQVKSKILDKAIMTHAENENYNLNDGGINMAIAQSDYSEFKLHFVSSTTKVLLEDFDSSSNISQIDDCIIVNTMKHYSMKSGHRFLLQTATIVESKCLINFNKPRMSGKVQVHLQIPSDLKPISNDRKPFTKKPSSERAPVSPTIEKTNKETYLLRLMEIQKSLSPFIDGFFQCLTNWKPEDYLKNSSNSLFEVNSESQMTQNLLALSNNNCFENSNSQILVSKELYLLPTYYLFSLLDDIALRLSITDEMTVRLWKSNSFILRFWVNLIKNPNFIFSVERMEPINDSLTTIAIALMESCSTAPSNVDINSPYIKQLFFKEVEENYSQWWKSFVNAKYNVNEADIITLMEDIVDTNKMLKYYNSSLRSLVAIDNVLSFK